MAIDFYMDVSLDISRHNINNLKQQLLTYLRTVEICDSYSFHDIDIVKRQKVNKEIICIHFTDMSSLLTVIKYIKKMKGIYVDCVYTDYAVIYASTSYSKKMDKEQVKKILEKPKNKEESEIINALRFTTY